MTAYLPAYRPIICLLSLLMAMVLSHPGRTAAASTEEYQIKAAMLYNIMRFIDWPESALPENSDKINICIATRGELGTAVEALRGKQLKGRTVTVRQTGRSSEMPACHVIVFSNNDRRTYINLLESTRSAVAVTIGDGPGFALSGGVVGFLIQDNRVRFEINLAAAGRHRIRISSQLLKLAHIVKEEP